LSKAFTFFSLFTFVLGVKKAIKANKGYSMVTQVYLSAILINFHFMHVSCRGYGLGAIEQINKMSKKKYSSDYFVPIGPRQ